MQKAVIWAFEHLIYYGQKSTKILQKCSFFAVEDKAKGKDFCWIFEDFCLRMVTVD